MEQGEQMTYRAVLLGGPFDEELILFEKEPANQIIKQEFVPARLNYADHQDEAWPTFQKHCYEKHTYLATHDDVLIYFTYAGKCL